MPKIAQNVTCVNGPLTMFIGPASFQERYLGGAKKRKKVRRLADRKFVFDWDTVKILAVFIIIIIIFFFIIQLLFGLRFQCCEVYTIRRSGTEQVASSFLLYFKKSNRP